MLYAIASSNDNEVRVNINVVVAVGFQANSTIILVSEDDGLVTFTFDITGSVDPTSVTTVFLTVIDDTATGKTCI